MNTCHCAQPMTIGVSSCLLGENVRYDGGHKRDCYIAGTLGRLFRLLPVCPEVGCGLSVPRETMRLEGDPSAPRLVTSGTRIDLTDRMLEYSSRKLDELAAVDLCGFIFKKNSPSCGLYDVEIFETAAPAGSGRGLFAAAVVARFPQLPVEEEGRLHDKDLRENFIRRVLACRRWKSSAGEGT